MGVLVAALTSCGDDAVDPVGGGTAVPPGTSVPADDEDLFTRVTDETAPAPETVAGSVARVDVTLPEPPTTQPVSTLEAPPDLCENGDQPVLVALDRADGSRRAVTCVQVDEEPELIAAGDGVALLMTYGRQPDSVALDAVDIESGSRLWTLDLGVAAAPRAVADSGRFYVRDVGTDDRTLRALDARTGSEVWRQNGVDMSWVGGDGLVALAMSPNSDSLTLRGMASDTGETRWTADYDAVFMSTSWGLDLLADDDTLFVPVEGEDGWSTYAIDILTGEERWRRPFIVHLAGEGVVLGLVDGDERQLGAWSSETAERRWVGDWLQPAVSYSGREMAQDRAMVVMDTGDGESVVLDVGTGGILWRDPSLSGVWSASDGSLVIDRDDAISLVDLETGEVSWTTAVRDPDLVAYVAGALVEGDTVLVSVVNNTGV